MMAKILSIDNEDSADILRRRMFALAFAGLPPPVNTDDGGAAGAKKTQTKSKAGTGGEVAKMLMNDDQLLAGETMTRRPQNIEL
jgi:hypothetical protein